MRPVNLARQPFRNERLPNIVFGVAVVAVLALTVRHVVMICALLPGRTSARHEEVARLEAEETSLRAEQANLRDVKPDPRSLARWMLVKDLVDRRAFSWTGLFARLEERLPDGARLVSIAPSVHKGEILLDVQAVMRSPEVGWQFMKALEEGGDFDSVFPLSEGEGGEFHYTMHYLPRGARRGKAAGTGETAKAPPGSETGAASAPRAGPPSEALP